MMWVSRCWKPGKQPCWDHASNDLHSYDGHRQTSLQLRRHLPHSVTTPSTHKRTVKCCAAVNNFTEDADSFYWDSVTDDLKNEMKRQKRHGMKLDSGKPQHHMVSINELTLRLAWLVLGWVWCSTPGAGNLSQHITSHPVNSAWPSLRNEYQPKGSDALQLGSKGGYGLCVGGR